MTGESEGDRLPLAEQLEADLANLLTSIDLELVTEVLTEHYRRYNQALVILTGEEVGMLSDLIDGRLDLFSPGTTHATQLVLLQHHLQHALRGLPAGRLTAPQATLFDQDDEP